jgi:formylglycine-generating enzyme required for sulfatase activity
MFDSAYGATKIPIAVVDFAISNLSEETSRQVTQKFRDALAENQAFKVLGRDEVDKSFEKVDLLYRTKMEQVDCQDVSCAVKVGTSLKIDKVIVGRIIKDEKDKMCVVLAKLISVSKGDEEFTASVEGPLDADLNQLGAKLGKKVAGWLPAPGESEETAKKRRIAEQKKEETEKARQREARLKKLTYRKPGTCPKGMILIKAGEFVMGSDPNDPDRKKNEVANKKVMVEEFCIDKYEYPNKQGSTPFRKAEWFAAKEECKAQGKRLCTEAEWEKACKGTKGFKYTYGNQVDTKKCNTASKEGGKLVKGRIAKSGSFKDCVNDYGIYDMSGNMWEWTADYYDPVIRTFVIRGGSFNNGDEKARCAARRSAMPFAGRKDTGFRCCK